MLLELHPLLCMPESVDPLVLDFPYVNDGLRHYEGTGSYANPDADLTWSIDQYAWSLGETVNAAIGAGLRVVRLDEHVEASFEPRGDVLRRSRCRCCSRSSPRRPAEGGTLGTDEPAG
jgi:hypothetical protein